MRSRPPFLRIGLTIERFHWSGKEPVENNKLMILIITGSSNSIQYTTIGVGIGSSLQVFFAEFSINLSTSFSDSCEKPFIMVTGYEQLLDGGQACYGEVKLLNFSWILLIFSRKYIPISLANDTVLHRCGLAAFCSRKHLFL